MALRTAVLLAALVGLPVTALAQSADNVLLVINESSPQSVEVGEYYAKARQVPARQIVRLTLPEVESIPRADYDARVEAPIAVWLARHLLQDQILFIVLTKGVPIRIDGSGGFSGTIASVDSELTLLYRKQVRSRVSVIGRTDNPYFLGEKPLSEAKRFSRQTSDIYLVTRLDGFTTDDVKQLIDRGVAPARDGQVVLDQKALPGDRGGDLWLSQAADRLSTSGHGSRVQLETTKALAAPNGPLIGYFSWGSNDPASQLRQTGFTFAPGAIGGLFVSTDGRTFREPPATWKPTIAGSTTGGQSLVGDLIREGITAVSGHVAEPFLDAIVRPQILFPAYLSGFNVAEAFYLAMPFLSWQDLVIGDPLCAPFMTTPLAQAELHKGIDEATALPTLFAERRLTNFAPGGLKPDALKLYLKALSWEAQGRPEAELESLLVSATASEPKLIVAHLRLAQIFEARADHASAAARYRLILAADPDEPVALNNLAYSLADKNGDAKEALPLAQKAYRLAGQSAPVGDTLGWVHYKLGDNAAALAYIERAARALPNQAEIQFHAAAVHAALGNLTQARTYLATALKLDATLGDRADVKELQGKIK